ncbi:MAG: hypothetical protein RIE24_06090 [Silicimonas sp.]
MLTYAGEENDVPRLATIFTVVVTLVFCTHVAKAETTFPDTRKAVGAGETYILEEFDNWRSDCFRDEDGEDTCFATTTVSDLGNGIEVYFDVLPFLKPTVEPNVDVNLVPRGSIEIAPYSSSPHYDEYSAAITKIDGQPFDGYWCELTDTNSCNRGPELEVQNLERILNGRSAQVIFYNRDATPDNYTEVTRIEVDLRRLGSAFNRANTFTAEVFGVDLEANGADAEMCTLNFDGEDRRISYAYDEDFDASSTSPMERLLGPKGSGNCPSYVSLAYMTPEMTPDQRDLFCLTYDKETNGLLGFQQGEQDTFRVCREPSKSVCEHVNDSKEAALAITGFAGGAVGSAVGTAAVTGTTVVTHSSGAAILTGASGYIAGTLGTIGTAALSVLTAPATIAAATVSVVAVGGAVYVCTDAE